MVSVEKTFCSSFGLTNTVGGKCQNLLAEADVCLLMLAGFGNRVWVNPSQQRGNYIQPSTFSQERSNWGSGGGGGGRRENVKSSDFSFSTQNRFSGLSSSNTFERGGRGGAAAGGGTTEEEDDNKKL